MPKKDDAPIVQLAQLSAIPLCIEKYGKGDYELEGQSSHAVAIIRRVVRALAKKGWPQSTIDLVQDEMTSGSYDHLLCVAMDLQADRQQDEEEDSWEF